MSVNTVEELYALIQSETSEWLSTADTFDPKLYEFVGVNLDDLVKSLMSKAKSVEELRKDMMILIMVTQMRGVNFQKILGRMKPEGKARFEGIISKYGIVTHRRDLPASTPTIPRILSLLPFIIYKVRAAHADVIGKPLGTVPRGLDQALCFPGGCAMIKTSNKDALSKWIEWYKSFCSAVKMNPTPSEDQMTIAFRLSKVDESDRV